MKQIRLIQLLSLITLLIILASCATTGEEPVSASTQVAATDRFDDIISQRSAELQQKDTTTVIINEVSFWNTTEYEAIDGSFPRWIELKNASDQPQQIEGWRVVIHDRDGSTSRFSAFPDLELNPGEIRVIAFVPELSKLPVRAIRFGAELPDTTSAIELIDGDEKSIDRFDITPIKENDWTLPSKSDFSQLRDTILIQEIRVGSSATPGLDNDVVIPTPRFTHESGFFDELIMSFDVSLLPEGYQIRYTINDGLDWEADVHLGIREWSYPTLVSGLAYTAPVPLTETSVIKARMYAQSGACSDMITKTYFIGEDTSLPIVSLSVDPADLWDDYQGIYTAGVDAEDPNYAKKAFRLVDFSYFEDNTATEPVIDDSYIFRIYGLSSRGYNQKSLAIYAKDPGTTERIPNEFFTEGSAKDIDSFYSIVLRNSGGDNPRTMFRDALATELTTGYGVEKQDYSSTIVFINGQYWGIYNIREKINEYFIEDHTGVDPNNVDLIEGSYRDSMEIKEGTFDAMDELFFLAKNIDPKYEMTYAMYDEMIDIDNFIDYVIFQMFINNGDWPWSNTKFWRPHTFDGKWRFILFDTDESFDTEEFNTQYFPDEGYPKGLPSFDMIAYVYSEENSSLVSIMLRQLMKNQGFYDTFFARYEYLLDTHLTSQMLQDKIDHHVDLIEEEMPRHCDRWTYEDLELENHSYRELDNWYHEVQVMRDFSTQRAEFVESHIVAFQAAVKPPGLGRIDNGDFEKDDLSMWDMRWSADKVFTEVIDHDDSKVGYFKILEGGENPWDAVAYAYDNILIDDGETLRLSFDIKAGSKFKSGEFIRMIILESASYDTIVTKDFVPSEDWEKERMTFTYDGPTVYTGRLQLRVGNISTGQEVFIDNLSIDVVE